jgi:ParB family chromosome partitioning protein
VDVDMKRLKHYDTFEIPIEEIFYDESFNCRGAFSLESIAELSESIGEIGLQFPVVVQPWEGRFRLLAGHRRYKACTVFLRWDKIPAVVRTDLNLHQARLLNLTENLERKDLNMLEEAKALQAMYPEGVSLRVAAAELKRPTRWVHTRQRLVQLPEEVQQLAAAGRIVATDIEALWNLPEDERVDGAQKITRCQKGVKGKLPKRLRRRFRPRKTKEQISKMTGVLINANINGLPPRLLAWTAGYITDYDIKLDIQKHAPEYQLESNDDNPWEDDDGTE